MANLKEVRNRISSVKSTQQITKAMKMVSAAKLKRATDAVLTMQPFAEKLSEIIKNVSAGVDTSLNKFGESREVQKVLIIALTSDKGLCGGFNSNITKKLVNSISENYSNVDVTVLPVGKKVADFVKREGINFIPDFSEQLSDTSFTSISKVATYAMDAFLSGEYDQVDLVFNEFKNVATQIVQSNTFLPLTLESEESASAEVDYIFEPNKEFILENLIPKALKTEFYSAVLNSVAGEHGARMTAMDKATDNAGELLKDLKLIYNRTRQAAITTEILEIVGGAEALASGK